MKFPLKQRGMALIMLVFIIGLATMGYLIHALNPATINIERDKKTALALAEAKAALIGWSIARGGIGTDRPGELPCPDNDAPGTANYGDEDATCVAGKVGRLPWKTLGIEEPLDGYGEPLWYSVDGAFRRRWGGAPSTNSPINSDTRASIQIFGSDGVSLITTPGSEAVAVIFSAGPPFDGQSRLTTKAVCASTGTNIAQNRCASNYLDVTAGLNNAENNGPFIEGERSSTFNDRIAFIKGSELMRSVEARVISEMRRILQDYYAVNGYYPYPAKFDNPGCLNTGSNASLTDCPSDKTICQGRFPDNAGTSFPTPNWTGSNALPGWLAYNLWGQVTVYAVDSSKLAAPVASCITSLTVNAAPAGALILMPGYPLGATVRNVPTQSLDLTQYLEDAANQDAWDVVPDTHFLSPSPTSNDKIYVLP